METAVKVIHVFVEVDANKPAVKVEFDSDQVTGRQIKEGAGVPLDYDLARRQGLEQVTNDQVITIKEGEHFVVVPPGTVS